MIFSTQNTSPLEMEVLDLVQWGEPGRLAGPAARHRSPHHHPPPPQRLETLASGWRQQQLSIPWLIKSIEASPETIASRQQAISLRGLAAMGQVPFEPPSVQGWPHNRPMAQPALAPGPPPHPASPARR